MFKPSLHTCPNPECQVNLIHSEIPLKSRCTDACGDGGQWGPGATCVDVENHHYGKDDPYFYRTVGFYKYDMTLFYHCPDCDAAWHRFTPGGTNVYRRTAEIHMKREGMTLYEVTS